MNLLRRTTLAEDLHTLDYKPVLHGDNGATLKATTVLAMMHWLGLRASYSRPQVSDDNVFVEALFRTAKYRPQFPVKGFGGLKQAREWASSFVRWYNDDHYHDHDHRHSAIRDVSPAQRHDGEDRVALQTHDALYQCGRAENPRRWARNTRHWNPIIVVTLNPERDTVIKAATENLHNSRPSPETGNNNLDTHRSAESHLYLNSGGQYAVDYLVQLQTAFLRFLLGSAPFVWSDLSDQGTA